MQNQVLNIVVQRNVSSGSKKTFALNKQRPSEELRLQRFEGQTGAQGEEIPPLYFWIQS